MPENARDHPGLPGPEEIAAAHALWRRDKRRIMDYFWSKRGRSERRFVPKSVIHYLEGERRGYQSSRTDFELFELESKERYLAQSISEGERGYKLTEVGLVYVVRRHPFVLQYWEKALELSPPTLSLVVAAISFVGSVFGIIQFFFP